MKTVGSWVAGGIVGVMAIVRSSGGRLNDVGVKWSRVEYRVPSGIEWNRVGVVGHASVSHEH